MLDHIAAIPKWILASALVSACVVGGCDSSPSNEGPKEEAADANVPDSKDEPADGGMDAWEKERIERFEFVREAFLEAVKEPMQCKDVSLTYQLSEQEDDWTFDVYSAKGCGKKTDAHMRWKSHGPGTVDMQWSFRLVPSEKQLKAEVEKLTLKVAKAELDCETMLGLVPDGTLSAGHNAYSAKVAATGCDRESEFVVSCSGQRYTAGKHEVVCTRER